MNRRHFLQSLSMPAVASIAADRIDRQALVSRHKITTRQAGPLQFNEAGLATRGPFPYFPSNGGLLYAVAMMAAGWDGAPKGSAPGFPVSWRVRSEGFSKAI